MPVNQDPEQRPARGAGPPAPPPGPGATGLVHLRRGGTSLVLRLDAATFPEVLHWGPDLGDLPDDRLDDLGRGTLPPVLDSVVVSPPRVTVLPQHAAGWLGRPGLLGSRAGRSWSTAFGAVDHVVEAAGSRLWPDGAEGAVRVRSSGEDAPGRLVVGTEIELHGSGLVRLRASVRNLADDVYEVDLVEPALPVPPEAGELLDMAGRHVHERTPQRRPFDIGSWVRESWGGRPGHDSPTVLCAGEPGFGWRRGRVWGVHVAHSGNQVFHAERTSTGHRHLRGAELLLPGEVRLGPGEEYRSPWLVGSWGEGLDELASRIHRFLRARPHHPRRPRPVLLNTWEAVYFDHDLPTLLRLAEAAASVGVERYVLDDGWFRGRRDDRAGLGDWTVDAGLFPDGLHPLVQRVRELGMEFGIWFEPEMVNADSDLARAHPDWLLQTEHGPGPESRYQQVLDLAHDGAYRHVLEHVSSVVAEYDVDFVKWDHNRPLVDAGHTPDGRPGVHAQTAALHRLLADLKHRHPGLEIESCAGGGGRLDLGMLELTDRVWPSDCIDALERQRLQRWTSLLLPPEVVGTHVGSPRDHTTQRTHTLSFRAGTAMWGHMGVEWDLTRAGQEDLDELRAWISLHKRLRPLLHHGDVVHADPTNPALLVEGVVAPDRSDALYRVAAVDHTLTWPPGRVTLPGLAPDESYEVTIEGPGLRPDGSARGTPVWAPDGVVQTGRVLGLVGVQAPLLTAESLILLRARAVG